MNTSALDDATRLCASLLASRYLPRQDPLVRRALSDAELFESVQSRLAQLGLQWVDNVYAEHVSVCLTGAAQQVVLGETGLAASNNLELPRDAQALLVVLWALIVLPKRERQTSRLAEGETQDDMFAGSKPLPTAQQVSPVISYKALLDDYGPQLGKKLRLDGNLRLLERHGFIERSQDDIREGPLLDVLLDYDVMAPRILDGALAQVLVEQRQTQEPTSTSVSPSANPVQPTETAPMPQTDS